MKPVVLMNLPPKVLHPSSLQMRVEIDESSPKFLDLLHSIEEGEQHDPVKARLHPTIRGEYEVGDGNSRVRVIKLLNETSPSPRTVLALISDYSDEEMMWLQRDENVVHQDITDYEDARWLKRMVDQFLYAQTMLADRCRKSPQWISQHLRMLELEPYLSTRTLNGMTEYQARMILEAPADLVPDICKAIEDRFKKYGDLPSAQIIRDSVIPLVYVNRTEVRAWQPVSKEEESPKTMPASPISIPQITQTPQDTQIAQEDTKVTQTTFDREKVEAFLRKYTPKQFKPEEQGGERGYIIHHLKGEGLSEEDANQVIDNYLRRLGIAPAEKAVKPRSLDVHKKGVGCPVCGRTLAPETYDRLAKKFKVMSLDDFRGLWN